MHADASREKKKTKMQVFLRELISLLLNIVSALVIVSLLTIFVFQIIGVDGTSMANTLQDRERMFVTKYQYLFGDPARFDVVICRYPDRGRQNFVKRVVGIPGDTVAVSRGVLYVNGAPVEEDYIDYPPQYTLPETVVAPGHYFVLGDNRANSNDSHVAAVGQLEREKIVGKVRAVIWPVSAWRAVR